MLDGPQLSVHERTASTTFNQKVHGKDLKLIVVMMMVAWLAVSVTYYALALNTGKLAMIQASIYILPVALAL